MVILTATFKKQQNRFDVSFREISLNIPTYNSVINVVLNLVITASVSLLRHQQGVIYSPRPRRVPRILWNLFYSSSNSIKRSTVTLREATKVSSRGFGQVGRNFRLFRYQMGTFHNLPSDRWRCISKLIMDWRVPEIIVVGEM